MLEISSSTGRLSFACERTRLSPSARLIVDGIAGLVAIMTPEGEIEFVNNVFPIEISALGERREDIPLLVEYFIDRYAVSVILLAK
ncbi:MAG: hypothetical protein JWO80_4537 [Bryobacterales bacterium]|nr:hypothetical protein [Bryobacterales bacterium]